MIWPTPDPFLFCVHHLDDYPAANARLGPAASLQGHTVGQDFFPANGDPWRMYHGRTVPGFPGHPHRGFETITVTRAGLIDHADSTGAAGRYGNGDTQWMTAGRGVQHSEMFPLLDGSRRNTLDFFQIWLNLPSEKKMTEPHFGMFWHEVTPRVTKLDDMGGETLVTIIAGAFDGTLALAPPPDSWAALPDNQVAIWTLDMGANARVQLPPTTPGVNRRLYFYEGDHLRVDDTSIRTNHYVDLVAHASPELGCGERGAKLLLLQGKPIDEPVEQNGPFVMNTRQELLQAFKDYQATQFGGWPWSSDEVVHPRDKPRFARYANGREDVPVIDSSSARRIAGDSAKDIIKG
jgi:hypothetical protein